MVPLSFSVRLIPDGPNNLSKRENSGWNLDRGQKQHFNDKTPLPLSFFVGDSCFCVLPWVGLLGKRFEISVALRTKDHVFVSIFMKHHF